MGLVVEELLLKGQTLRLINMYHMKLMIKQTKFQNFITRMMSTMEMYSKQIFHNIEDSIF